MASLVYLDSSAIVKLAVREPESEALRKYLLRRRGWVSSALARTEVLRALLPNGELALAAGRNVLTRCVLVRINDRVLGLAATLLPLELRSLDAIHLATAERIRDELSQLITYDDRMADAARELGHRVAAPS
jgi:predicted nucleic acid-binding protein